MPSQVPQFVMFGSDDNPYAAGVNWLVDTAFGGKTNPDGTPAQITFFITAGYGTDQMYGNPPVAGVFNPGSVGQTPQDVVNAWKHAYASGHEIGNHTWDHAGPANGSATPTTVAGWQAEINPSQDFLTNQVGVPACELDGDRFPFLLFNEAGFQAYQGAGFLLDTSVEFGYNWWVPSTCNCTGMGNTSPESGKYYWWPFTLDNGFPSDSNSGFTSNLTNGVLAHAGMWEFLEHTFNAPNAAMPGSVLTVTGLDYNLWLATLPAFNSNHPLDFCQTLEYSFLQRYQNNRAPFNVGIHSMYYSGADVTYDMDFGNTVDQRRAALQCFIDFLFSGQYPDVRVVGFHKVIEWLRNPTPIH
jgi:hypothetical protein